MKRILLFLSLISLPFSIISNVKAASYASDTLKGKVVTEGDGLYEDKYARGRYVYKGGNPNNFIKFNNELWRIISVETDGTLKIIRVNPLDNPTTKEGEKVIFNDDNSINYGTYCSIFSNGCEVWAKTEYIDNGVSASTTPTYFQGTVTEDSLINRYLNNDYYQILSDSSKCTITAGNYYFGPVHGYDDKVGQILYQEREQVWNGNIGLPSFSDVLLATTNETACGTDSSIVKNYYTIVNGEKVKDCTINGEPAAPYKEECYNDCSDTNWLMPSRKYKFTDYNYSLINAYSKKHGYYGDFGKLNGQTWAISYQGFDLLNVGELYTSTYNNTFTFRPVTYLRNDMEITKGDGSENNPYEFKCDECDGTNNNSKNESNLIVDVPPTSMFISAFIIGGFILIAVICIVIYLKVFKKKDVK